MLSVMKATGINLKRQAFLARNIKRGLRSQSETESALTEITSDTPLAAIVRMSYKAKFHLPAK